MSALTIHCHEFRRSWYESLPIILYAFRATVSTTTGYSPSFLLYGREAPLPFDSLFKLEHQHTVSLPVYAQQLERTFQNVYKGVAKSQAAAVERNRVARDRREGRVAIVYEPGESVLVWGPTAAGAPYPDKTKLLYQWSKPMIVKERVSDLRRLLERVELKNSTQFRISEVVHVKRLRAYTPLPDGAPSVQNSPPPPHYTWAAPAM